MKKLLLLALVVFGGVIETNADVTQTVRFVACDEVGLGEQGRKLYLYICDGNGYEHTASPGIEMSSCIGSYTKDNNTRYWYECFVDIPTDKLSSIKWKFTNDVPEWGNGKETVLTNLVDLSSTEYCSWIYAGEYGQIQNLSIAPISYYLWDTSTASTSANLIEMIKEGQTVKKNIDANSISDESKKNYLIIPSYAISDGNITNWQFAYRPITVSGNYLVDGFGDYSYTGEISNSEKNWEFKKVLESTFAFSFNVQTKGFTLKPSFTRTISSGYATFSYGAAVTIPSGVNAYYASSLNNGKVVLTKNNSGKIAANDGALLVGSGEVTFTPATDATAYQSDEDATVRLVATVTSSENNVSASSTGSYNYMLANGTNGVGFYYVNAAATSAAGKAYLHSTAQLTNETSGARATWIFVDEDATAIKQVATTARTNEVFDLQGRRVAQPTKGLYIVNGKKVIK